MRLSRIGIGVGIGIGIGIAEAFDTIEKRKIGRSGEAASQKYSEIPDDPDTDIDPDAEGNLG